MQSIWLGVGFFFNKFFVATSGCCVILQLHMDMWMQVQQENWSICGEILLASRVDHPEGHSETPG